MPKEPLQQITVGSQFAKTVSMYGNRIALISAQGQWTYHELDKITDQIASGLLALGMRRGDVLAVWCEAEANTVFMLYAALKIGVTAAMMNTSLRDEEAHDILLRSDAKWLAVGDGYKDVDYLKIAANLKDLPLLEGMFTIGRKTLPNVRTLNDICELGSSVSAQALTEAKAAVQPMDVATMLYTSGTTSRPKIVLDSHYSRMNMGIRQAGDLRCTCEDRFCVAIPLFHCFCTSVNTMAAMAVGGCLVLPENRRTDSILQAIETHGCTVLNCVPALFHALIAKPGLDINRLKSLRVGYIGGSLYPPELFREIEKVIGFRLMSSLGQTECTAGVTTCDFDDPLEVRALTVGHFLDDMEGRAVDIHTGAPLPVGQSGELCVRGYGVMQGYYHAEEATAKAIDSEGFLHTGDMGYIDEDGNVHLTGRLKDLIIRGGENISPSEIENTVVRDDRVYACRAIGVPDTHYGEEVCLCVQLKPGAVMTEEELRTQLSALLAHYKVPRYIVFVPEFPRSETGKIKSGELLKLVLEEYLPKN